MSEITIIKRNTKEIKLFPTASENFKATYGTVNRLEPNVIYVKLFAWAQHTDDIHEYKTNVTLLNKTLKTKAKVLLHKSGVLSDVFFLNLNMKKCLYKEDDCFHSSVEFTIRQKSPMCYDITELKDIIDNFVNEITNVLDSSVKFDFKISR